jgi:hypothetical protein
MTRLPRLGHDVLLGLVTADIGGTVLEQPAGGEGIASAIERVFGPDGEQLSEDLKLPPAPSLRQVYAALVDSDQFRTACGRISASYAW